MKFFFLLKMPAFSSLPEKWVKMPVNFCPGINSSKIPKKYNHTLSEIFYSGESSKKYAGIF